MSYLSPVDDVSDEKLNRIFCLLANIKKPECNIDDI
jgi:hypothetical protein